MQGSIFNPQQLKTFLQNNGYTKADIEANFPTYLENFLSGLITHILDQLSPDDRDEVVGNSDLDTAEGCREVIERMNKKLKGSSDMKKFEPSKEQILSFIMGF